MAHYEVPSWKMGAVRKKVDALNKKAERFGIPTATIEVGETFSVLHQPTCECCAGTRADQFTTVGLIGGDEVVRAEDGWALVAVIDHSFGEPIVKAVWKDAHPDTEIPERYRNAEPVCDHCGAVRNRKDTFLLEKDGDHKQVGRTCLRDYLGDRTAQFILAYAQWVDDMADAFEMECRGLHEHGETTWELVAFLAYTAVEIEQHGWMSRTEARDKSLVSTADMVISTVSSTEERRDSDRLITDALRAEAVAAVDWAANMEPGNDYLVSIHALAKIGCTNQKNAGFAASILTAYRREQEREVARKVETEQDAGHFGEVGKRTKKISVTLMSQRDIEGQYGTTRIYKLRTDDGHNLVWFASKVLRREDCRAIEIGARLSVDLTVKGHGDFRGVSETRVNRVSLRVGDTAELMLQA